MRPGCGLEYTVVPKLNVVGSIPISRSTLNPLETPL